jgi:hypothetical protein
VLIAREVRSVLRSVDRIRIVAQSNVAPERNATMMWRATQRARHWVGRLAVAGLVGGGVLLSTASGVAAQPPDPDRASCVEQFNLAVGTPGEYQRAVHQDALGRDVSAVARLSEADCPF